MDFKPGDHITVKVGGVEYDTVIDEHDVQRFIADPLIQKLQRAGIIDLNRLSVAYHYNKVLTQREYAELNMKLGYSVSGFCDLSSFSDMPIENPVWDNENPERLSTADIERAIKG